MFNKRESNESETASRSGSDHYSDKANPSPAPTRSTGGTGAAATIGPSISIDGQLKGEEDLVVEGRVKGTIELKNNTLTIGTQGTLDAEVFAHTIFVEGTVNGDLYASERISIRKSARISGNILAPRISLEDGARFRGSIDMDADSEAFRKAFGGKASAASSPAGKPTSAPSVVDSQKDKQSQGPQASSGGGAAPSTQQTGKTGSSAA
ncbi:MAG TPA: polymer-forming cytoskeletal protein [Wenzhouxiangellaceae bacterium]|nr:polymer-forming cytoskeletal protein [Wenzhouxiangellaceae bacterium]